MILGSYVIGVAADAPPISQLHAIDGLQLHRLRADGSRLGYIQSDEAAIGIEKIPEDLAGHGRDRGRALRQRRRPRGHHPRPSRTSRPARWTGGSTITMQLARNLYIDDPERDLERRSRSEDRRGARGGALKGLDHRELPEHRLLRDRQRPHRRRGRGGGPDLLLEEGGQARPGGVGDARRPAPVALALQPAAEPAFGVAAPQRGARGDGEEDYIGESRVRGRDRPADRTQPRQPLRGDPRPTSSTSTSSS